MKSVERVDGWRTSDGQMFSIALKKEAEEHQGELNFRTWAESKSLWPEFVAMVLLDWKVERKPRKRKMVLSN